MSNSIIKIPNEEQPRSPRETLPTMYDLPSEEVGELGMPDEFHVFQAHLLRETFQPQNYNSDQFFVGIDINLYYDAKNPLWCKRPDWFAAVGVPRLYDNKDMRYSYVIWQESIDPLVIIEFLSASTEKEDLGKSLRDIKQPPTKWQVYEQILRIPFYFTFDRLTDKLTALRLEGDKYKEFSGDNDKYYIDTIELSLGFWQGKYEEIDRLWLRWYDKSGNLIPSRPEQIELAEQQKELAEQQKELAIARVQQLVAKLKELGIDPDSI